MTDEQDHQYSVQISGPKGLHVIAVVAGSDREAVGKLRTVAGRNNIHTDVFYQDRRRLPSSRWDNALGA